MRLPNYLDRVILKGGAVVLQQAGLVPLSNDAGEVETVREGVELDRLLCRGDVTNAAEELPGSRMLRREECVGRCVDELPILRHHAPCRYCGADRPGARALFRCHTAVRRTVFVAYVA